MGPLGGDEFIATHADFDGPLAEIPRPQWQPLPPPLTELFHTLVEAALPTAHRRYRYPLREIADHLGVHYSTVGRRLNAWEETEPTEPFPPDV